MGEGGLWGPMNMLLPLVFLACSPPQAEDSAAQTGADPTGGTQLGLDLDLAVAPAELAPSALVVTWTATDQLDGLKIACDRGGGSVIEVAADPATGRQILVGFKPQMTVSVRLLAQIDGVLTASDWTTAETGPLSPELPAVLVDAAEEGALGGGAVVVTHVQSPPAVLVVDGDGDIVWWRIMDQDAWVSRARVSADGEHILVNAGLQTLPTPVGMRRLSLDGELVDSVVVEDAHHDFVELPDGTLAFLAAERRDLDGESVVGDQLVEVSPDGQRSVAWSVFDLLPYQAETDTIPGDEWTHANALSYDIDTGSYLVSMSGLTAVLSVDQATATLNWVFGGPYSDFTDAAGHAGLLGFHHGVDLTGDTLVIFENLSQELEASAATEYSLDPEDPTVSQVWTYRPEPTIYTPTLGNVQRLYDGATMVNFATAGRVTEVMPDGTVRWQIATGLGGALGYAELTHRFE